MKKDGDKFILNTYLSPYVDFEPHAYDVIKSKDPNARVESLVYFLSDDEINQVIADFEDFLLESGYDGKEASQITSYHYNELRDMLSLKPLYDEILDQEIDCRLGVKGDGYAGLLWLGTQFGYEEEQLRAILEGESEDEPQDSFLEELGEEAEEGKYIRGEHLYFYGKSTLREMLKQREEHTQVTVSPECSCGIFSASNGDGSSFGIELKGKVVVPNDMISEFVPDTDTRSGYSIYATFGFTPDGHLIVR